MKTIKLIAKWIKSSWWLLLLSLVILVLLNYIRSLVPVFVSQVIYILDPKTTDLLTQKSSPLPEVFLFLFKNKEQITQLIIVSVTFLGVIILRDLSNFLFDICNNYVAEKTGQNIQMAFYNKIQDLPTAYLNHAETGDLIQRALNDVTKIKRFMQNVLGGMMTSLLLVVFYFLQMLRINVYYALLCSCLVPVVAIIAFIYAKIISPKIESAEETEGKFLTVAQESLTNIRVVKAFNNEKYEMKQYKNATDEYVNAWMKINGRMSIFWGATDVLCYIQIILSIAFGYYFMTTYNLNLADTVLMIGCTSSLIWPARNFGRQVSELTKTEIATQRINDVLDKEDEYIINGTLKPLIKGNIIFKNVGFKFFDTEEYLFKNLSFEIKAGETVAIIGRTGEGKTTLISLINRLLERNEGEIFIDGELIDNIEKHYLRKNIGVVLQEPFLYSTTVEENISVLLDKIDTTKVKRAAALANIEKDILKFKDQYETKVGERGITLSGGQKQRLAIARILTNEKPILIFDDSLSAVDAETDQKIRKSLKEIQNQVTTIIITHRVTTAMNADKILVLDKGSIADLGKHEELITRPGLYKKIWDIQSQLGEE
ncbi:MAG: ABC transporter ATP-binding protein/permease [Bacillales bacterium]|jgi:ATP-binding cassette subfamily B protein|nr:ABC transporter ATP-binding protein/permease [Bacillales bacterium]